MADGKLKIRVVPVSSAEKVEQVQPMDPPQGKLVIPPKEKRGGKGKENNR